MCVVIPGFGRLTVHDWGDVAGTLEHTGCISGSKRLLHCSSCTNVAKTQDGVRMQRGDAMLPLASKSEQARASSARSEPTSLNVCFAKTVLL